MDDIKAILWRTMEGYAGKAANGFLYLTISPDRQVYSVIGIAHLKNERFVNTALFVHMWDEHIIIERDQSDKPLVDALVQAGVPRSQIILAYAGEAVPEMA